MSNGFIDWLQTVCDRIADQEEQGKTLIESGDTAGYRAIMRKKAELLASLDKEGGVHLAALPAALRERARAGLRNFASGAANALSIDSVFYMSALLYPDEAKPGEPNNLERFRDELKAAL
ncbi:MAG: hypothetical protein KHZ29_04885 [Desulfovibrionaceae bacterium]|nr:hypothetical protein [Desulfovibrionaceae bacterium]